MEVREFRAGDGDASLALFAGRNPGLFLLSLEEREMVATALGGWDGRRGWLYHVAVAPDRRRRGIAERLVRTLEERLRGLGCKKVNLIVWEDSPDAARFWKAMGYARERAVEFGKGLGPSV